MPTTVRHRAMVGVAQLAEHLVVVQVVAGSNPVTHPDHAQGPDFPRKLRALCVSPFFPLSQALHCPGLSGLGPPARAARCTAPCPPHAGSSVFRGIARTRRLGPCAARRSLPVAECAARRQRRAQPEAASVGFAVRSAGGARRGSPALIPDQAVRSSSRLLFSGYRRDLDQSVRRGPVIPKPHSRTCFFSVA